MSSVSDLTGMNLSTLSKRGVGKKGESPSLRRPLRERRHWQRLPLPVPIFARGVDENGKEFLEFTTTLNISAGGVLLAMRRPLSPDARVFLEIPAAPLPRVAIRPQFARSLQARILRVTPSEPAYIWALRFETPINPS
ncbi:MAG TPA: PilZ domain-containing protein [Terriglobia bacterium]|nr:PilZ domain-containing protein [Terriglobia bacterium]